MTFGIILAVIGLAALIVSAIMLVRRDPETSQALGEARGFVQDSYTALRNRELGSLEDSIDDVSLGEFFISEDAKRRS